MALVDELHDDGCLLRERWDEIEARLADMVAKRLQSVPQGPNPSFDWSYVIRGHRVIRCDDGYSKIFLEDCVAKIRKAWHGLPIRLVHASEIPCEAALAAGQDQRITSSTEDMEQTEKNSFGWIVPRGAQLSDTAIQKIKELDLTKRKRNRQKFLVPDGLKTWRVTLCGGGGIRIGHYTRPAVRKEQPEETEEDHLKQSHQMEERNQIEEAQQIIEEDRTFISDNTDGMSQEDKIPQAKETEMELAEGEGETKSAVRGIMGVKRDREQEQMERHSQEAAEMRNKVIGKNNKLWAHFIRISEFMAKCMHCGKTLSSKHSSSNLMRHIVRRHNNLAKSLNHSHQHLMTPKKEANSFSGLERRQTAADPLEKVNFDDVDSIIEKVADHLDEEVCAPYPLHLLLHTNPISGF